MRRVSAVVTREGQTWLYTGIGYRSLGFFGTRGTATTKHATIVRLSLDPTFPGVPVTYICRIYICIIYIYIILYCI